MIEGVPGNGITRAMVARAVGSNAVTTTPNWGGGGTPARFAAPDLRPRLVGNGTLRLSWRVGQCKTVERRGRLQRHRVVSASLLFVHPMRRVGMPHAPSRCFDMCKFKPSRFEAVRPASWIAFDLDVVSTNTPQRHGQGRGQHWGSARPSRAGVIRTDGKDAQLEACCQRLSMNTAIRLDESLAGTADAGARDGRSSLPPPAGPWEGPRPCQPSSTAWPAEARSATLAQNTNAAERDTGS